MCGFKHRKNYSPKYILNNALLHTVEHIKDLGVSFSNTLSFNIHLISAYHRCYYVVNHLFRIFRTKSISSLILTFKLYSIYYYYSSNLGGGIGIINKSLYQYLNLSTIDFPTLKHLLVQSATANRLHLISLYSITPLCVISQSLYTNLVIVFITASTPTLSFVILILLLTILHFRPQNSSIFFLQLILFN